MTPIERCIVAVTASTFTPAVKHSILTEIAAFQSAAHEGDETVLGAAVQTAADLLQRHGLIECCETLVLEYISGCGDSRRRAAALVNVATWRLERGLYAAAMTAAETAFHAALEAGNARAAARAAVVLSDCEAANGNTAVALRHLDTAFEHAEMDQYDSVLLRQIDRTIEQAAYPSTTELFQKLFAIPDHVMQAGSQTILDRAIAVHRVLVAMSAPEAGTLRAAAEQFCEERGMPFDAVKWDSEGGLQ